jgi:hypothetical protein
MHGLKSGRQGRRPYQERRSTGLPASRGVIKYPMNNCVISSTVYFTNSTDTTPDEPGSSIVMPKSESASSMLRLLCVATRN